MRNLKSIFLLLLFASLFMGCAQQQSEGIYQAISSDIYNSEVDSISEQTNKHQEEIVSVTEPDDVLILRQALALTLMHNPELKVFSLETRAAGARELQAGLWPNPEIEIEAENVGGTGELSGFDAAETTIAVSQLIELADKAQKRKKVASLESELAGWDYKSKRLDVFIGAANAFVDVLGAQRSLALNQELLTLSEKLVETVSQRVEAGKDPPIEREKAKVLKAKIEIQANRSAQDLQAARKKLVSFWSSENAVFARAQGQLDSIKPVPAFSEIREQLANNPDIARWETEFDRADAKLDLEKARGVQDVTLSAGVQRFNETDDNAFVVGVSIPLPLFDRNQGNILAARNDKLKARQLQKNARLQIYSQLSEAYSSLSNSYTQAIKTKQDVLSGARAAFQTATEAYEQGKAEYLVVLDAQRTLFEAEASYIDSLVSYHKAKADIERLTGQPIQTIYMEK